MIVEVSVLSVIQLVAEKFVWALIAEVLDLVMKRMMSGLLLVFPTVTGLVLLMAVMLTGKSAAEQLVGVLAVFAYCECEAVLAGVNLSLGKSVLELLVVALDVVLKDSDGGKCELGPLLRWVFGIGEGC